VILEKIFNAIFILGLNQEQFKEKLATIYGQQNWPDYEVLSQELNMYAEVTEQMETLTSGKCNNYGIIGAHMGKAETTIKCWKCGSKNHIKSNCPRPQHKCGVCKKVGHLKKHCFEKKENKTKEKSRWATRRIKAQEEMQQVAMVRKAKAHMAAEDDEVEDEAYYVEEDEEENYSNLNDEEEYYQGYMVRINEDEENEEKKK
jgi:hypothetical protein